MPSGTTGKIISLRSNNNLGKRPSPFNTISTYGDVDDISGSSTYKLATFSNIYGVKGLKLALIVEVDPGQTTPSLGIIQKILSMLNWVTSIHHFMGFLSGLESIISQTVGIHLSGVVMIFRLYSITCGSIRNLGLRPLQVMNFCIEGKCPYLANWMGTGILYYRVSLGENLMKNTNCQPG